MEDSFERDAHLKDVSYSPGMAAAWFVGIALFISILIFAFGGEGTSNPPPLPCKMEDLGNGFYRITPEARCKRSEEYTASFRSLETNNPGRKLEYIGNDMFVVR